MASKRFESLDGLRGVCALFVALYHYNELTPLPLLRHSYICVDFFFVLSGFVIAYVYEERLKLGLGLFGFIKRRAERLFPTQFLGTAIVSAAFCIAFGIGTVSHSSAWTSVAMATLLGLLLIPYVLSPNGPLYPINSPLWSLLDEWIINAAYAIFLYRLPSRLLWLSVVAIWCALFLYALTHHTGLLEGQTAMQMPVGIGRAASGFLAGMVVYRMHDGGRLLWLPPVRPGLTYALVFCACAAPTRSAVLDVFCLAMAPVAIAFLARSEMATPRLFVWLGSISYPLYVVHVAGAYLIGALVPHGRNVFYPLLALTTSLVLAWTVSRAKVAVPSVIPALTQALIRSTPARFFLAPRPPK